MAKFSEENEIRTVLAPDADRWTSNPATDVVSLKYWDHVTFIVTEGAGGVGTRTTKVEKCTSKAAANNTAIAFNYRVGTYTGALGAITAATSAGYLQPAGANKHLIIEVDAAELGPSYPFVRLTFTETDSTAVDAAVIAILSKSSYPQATQPISLS